MSRRTLRYAVIALLGGVAVAIAAATLPTAQRSGESSGAGGDEGGDGSLIPPLPEDSPASTIETPPFLTELLWLVAILAVVGAVWYLFRHWRDALRRIMEGVILAGGLFLLFHLASLFFRAEFEPGEFGFGDDETLGGGGNGAGDQLVSTDPSSLSVVLLLAAALVLAGLAVLVTQDTSDAESDSPDDDTDTAAAVGRAAGNAASRLEDDTEADNDIYRAWMEMAELVGPPDRETKTTAEFADAAIEAGMEPADVRELTTLFEQVRYGTDEPTASDEQQAIALFRRLEATYSEERA